MDCGRALAEATSPAADKVSACVKKQLSSKRPFRSRYVLPGIDSEVAAAIVRTAGGQVIELHFDSMGMMDEQGGVKQITEYVCQEPIKLHRTDGGYLRCFRGGQLPD